MIVQVTLEGTRPLLQHQDNVQWSEKIKKWSKDPDNKSKSVAGDDRSPAFTWLGAMYHDGAIVVIPSDNIMTMMREGGTQVLTGQGKKTFKAQTQSGLLPLEPDWPIFKDDGNTITVAELLALESEMDFARHVEVVQAHGFDLFVKRAKIGMSKHVRVRPILRNWSTVGTLEVLDDDLTPAVIQRILDVAGKLKGLGDWRPSSKTPGPYGTFNATVEVIG